MQSEIRPFKQWDKVFYHGENRSLLYRLWTITKVDPLPPRDAFEYTLEAADDDREAISWSTTNPALISYVYSGAPKYEFNDKVYHFFDNVYVAGIVQVVNPSLNNAPNVYEVIFENGREETLQESQIFQFDPNKLLDSTVTTQTHVRKVRDNIGRVVSDLIARGEVHDSTKYRDPEKVLLDAMEFVNTNEGPAPYGTDEYRRRTAMLKPMLKHHYEHNTHHPEHYPNGVMDMSLMDIVEMLCDWQAASVRNKDPMMDITHSCVRFCIDDQMKRIFMNTADLMGWKYK